MGDKKHNKNMNNKYHNLMLTTGSMTPRFDAAPVRGDLAIAKTSATYARCDMNRFC